MKDIYENPGIKVAAALHRGGCWVKLVAVRRLVPRSSKTFTFIRCGELAEVTVHFYEDVLRKSTRN